MSATHKRLTFRMGAAIAVAACGAWLAGCERAPAESLDHEITTLVGRYCTECHNNVERVADLSLESVSAAHLAQHPDIWEEVVRKLRGNIMPPPGGPRPDADQTRHYVRVFEAALDRQAAERGPAPGRVGLHRLNRTEYARVIHDLLGLHIDARALLPADTSSDGFDNIASVLGMSPTHLDRYIAAARDISLLAVGNPRADTVRSDYRSTLRNGTLHVDGLPLGTRDGMLIQHHFPADGEYIFNINVNSDSGTPLRAYPQGWIEHRHQLIMTLDGEVVFTAELGGEEDSRAIDRYQMPAVQQIRNRFRDIRLQVPAGRREVGVTFIARSMAQDHYLLQSFVPGRGVPDVPRIFGTEILGPYEPSGISGRLESRERIFICYPETAEEERPCAQRILTNLANQAFRRPVDEADIAPLMAFYDEGTAGDRGFESGIQRGLFGILSSVDFLYRAEPGTAPADAAPGSTYAISDLELAWRLAFFLWSQGPDEELLQLAEAGRLSDDSVLDAQVSRMLADPRSESLVTNFAFQWLEVRRLRQLDPDPRLYPNFDEDLRNAFEREMQLFLDSILRADVSVVELLTADYTFVNDRLARHYGIPDVRTERFRRVALADSRRHGLLGKGSVLMVTSYPDRTSPVLRGAWIMDHLLGTPAASPPPGVETNLTDVEGMQPRSVRERLEQHRTDPSCNHCHGVIDPLGQPLETFDVIGELRWRERDTGVEVDPTGVLAGTDIQVSGPDDLREALAADPEQFVRALTEKLMTYALGRSVQYYDLPTVRAIVADAAVAGYRFESIVRGIVHSAPFRMRSVPQTQAPDGATTAMTGGESATAAVH